MSTFVKHVTVIVLAVSLSIGLSLPASAFPPSAKDADLYAVQAMLQSLGYYTGQIDGQYGPGTKSSVAAYQQSSGINATGELDGATFRSLLQTYARVKTAELTRPNEGQASTPSGNIAHGLTIAAEEQQMIDLVNAARREVGAPPLTANAELSRVARFKSEDMAEGGYFSHDSPTYGSPFQMMEDFGITFTGAGENIACNQSVQQAHDALMNSPGHRANILNTDYTEIGIGIVNGGPCGAMYTQMFLRP